MGLSLDIRVGDGHALPGGAWLEFIGSCRAMLGTPSGSSLLDPDGDIQRRVRAHLRGNPGASFEQVEQSCFAGLDGLHAFTAISPRALEAALAGTAQLLVEGNYSGILKPHDHYLPLAPDAGNMGEILKAMRDGPRMQDMIRRCRESILSEPRLRRASRDAWLRGLVLEHRSRAGRSADVEAVAAGVRRYEHAMQAAYRRLWRQQAWQAGLRRLLDRSPARIAFPLRTALSRLRGRA